MPIGVDRRSTIDVAPAHDVMVSAGGSVGEHW